MQIFYNITFITYFFTTVTTLGLLQDGSSGNSSGNSSGSSSSSSGSSGSGSSSSSSSSSSTNEYTLLSFLSQLLGDTRTVPGILYSIVIV